MPESASCDPPSLGCSLACSSPLTLLNYIARPRSKQLKLAQVNLRIQESSRLARLMSSAPPCTQTAGFLALAYLALVLVVSTFLTLYNHLPARPLDTHRPCKPTRLPLKLCSRLTALHTARSLYVPGSQVEADLSLSADELSFSQGALVGRLSFSLRDFVTQALTYGKGDRVQQQR